MTLENLRSAADFARSIVSLRSAIQVILLAVVSVYSVSTDYAKQVIRAVAGTDEQIAAIAALSRSLGEQSDQVGRLRDEMVELTEQVSEMNSRMPPRRITLYDEAQSRVLEPCHIGGVCHVQFVARRSEWGLACGRPTSLSAWILQPGQPRQRVTLPGSVPVRVGGEFERLMHRVTIPDQARTGPADFMIEVVYPACPGSVGDVVESTPMLPFIINPKS